MRRAWVLSAMAVVILVFALATGHPMFWRSFYVFGLLLLLAGVWVWLLVRGISVDVRRPAFRSHAGGQIAEQILVRRHGRLLQGFVEVRERTDMPVPAPGAVLSLGDTEVATADLVIPCPRRGVFHLGPMRVTASDPFGLFQWERAVGQTQQLIVHPATIELPGFILLPADLPGEGSRHIRSHQVTTSAFGVRDYAFGDSLNRMSWKATAHHGRLMVKEFEIEPTNNIWVVLDMERRVQTGAGDGGTEETSVNIAASVCNRYLGANYPVGLLCHGDEDYALPAQRGSGQMVRIMDALAAVRAQGNSPLLKVLADLHSRAGRYTSIAIITPSSKLEWLDGVRHLLERRSRITVIVVDGNLAGPEFPVSARSAAALGIPTYVVKRGAERTTGLVPLIPVGQQPMESHFARAAAR